MSDDLLLSDPVSARACGGSTDIWSPFGGASPLRPSPALRIEERPGPGPGVKDTRHPLGSRRREPRFLAVENRVWLQWWQDGDCLGRCARLVNVSRNGAMITACVMLRENQRLKIFLEEPAHEIGANATVLAVIEGVTGMHQIRLGFLTPCPAPFIEAAANGFEAWLRGSRPKS